MKAFTRLARLIAYGALTLPATAQGPHEIALIVNANSPDSLEIAHHYAHVRRVPSANVIYLDLPPDFALNQPLSTFALAAVEPPDKAERGQRQAQRGEQRKEKHGGRARRMLAEPQSVAEQTGNEEQADGREKRKRDRRAA